jgi:predicted dehydrogenase
MTTNASKPLSIGLVGAGPWAQMIYAPTISSLPSTTLAGVWARRPEASAALAAEHGTHAFENYADLLDHCDAVAFCVPPDVQESLAKQAASHGKALLLEKPIGLRLSQAQDLTDAIDAAGVISQIMLTWRYATSVREFLRQCHATKPIGARAWIVSSAFNGGPFATPWRLEHGPLLDLAPHLFEVLDAAVGPITNVTAHGTKKQWVGVLLDHEGGAHSEVTFCASAGVNPTRAGVEVYSADGFYEVTEASAFVPETFATAFGEFADAVQTNSPHSLDVHRGLYLQRHIESALLQLTE